MIWAIYLIVLYALASGYLYRWRGGGWPTSKKSWPNWLRGLHRLLRVTFSGSILCLPLWFLVPWWAAGAASILTVLAVTMGHGDWLDFGTSKRTDPGEWLNPLVHLLTSKRNGPLHDTIGMTLSGLSYTLPPAVVAVIFLGPWWALWLPIGALKGVAYWLGWNVKLPSAPRLEPTVVGEFLTGFFLCGTAGLLSWVLL